MKKGLILIYPLFMVVLALVIFTACHMTTPDSEQSPASTAEQPSAPSNEQPVDPAGEQPTESGDDTIAEPASDEVDKQIMTPELEAKVAAGLADPDPVIAYAWTMIKRFIGNHGRDDTLLTDAEIIRLECTDRFDDWYDDRVIEAYALEYRIKPEDISIYPYGGVNILDEEGWIVDKTSMGLPWLIAENRGGEISVVGECHPLGEGRGVPLCALDVLMHRDLEQGLDIARLALLSLQYSIRPNHIYEMQLPVAYFQIPQQYPYPEQWDIEITGQIQGEDSPIQIEVYHLDEGKIDNEWEPGGSYITWLEDVVYSQLKMTATLPIPDSEPMTIEIDLLPYIIRK